MPTTPHDNTGSSVPEAAVVESRPVSAFGPPTHRERVLDGHEVVRSLIRVGEHLSSSATLAKRMVLLCKETATLLGCDRSSIMLWDGATYRAAYNWGNPSDIAERFGSYSVPAEAPLMIEMENAASFVVINDAASHPSTSAIAEIARINSIVVAPMTGADGERLGFLTAEYNERLGTFSRYQPEIVLGVARLAQTAVITNRDRRHRRQANLSRAAMLTKLVDSEDEERRRVARELHDDSIQRLYALQLRLETVEAQQTPIELPEIAGLVADAKAASNSLRSLLSDVHPTAIDGRTLGQALRLALERKADTANWATAIINETTSEPSTTNLTVLFRISLQALHNAALHASASSVTVHLRTVDRGTEVRVCDNGCGFDPLRVSADRFGLTLMAERARGAGGSFSIDSHPSQGTEITAWLPNGS